MNKSGSAAARALSASTVIFHYSMNFFTYELPISTVSSTVISTAGHGTPRSWRRADVLGEPRVGARPSSGGTMAGSPPLLDMSDHKNNPVASTEMHEDVLAHSSEPPCNALSLRL